MLRGVREVANFARRMVQTLNLPKNASKIGWQEMTIDQLEAKLDEEYWEVKEAIKTYRTARIPLYSTAHQMTGRFRPLSQRLSEECVDLSNICMMLTNNVGGLNEDV